MSILSAFWTPTWSRNRCKINKQVEVQVLDFHVGRISLGAEVRVATRDRVLLRRERHRADHAFLYLV